MRIWKALIYWLYAENEIPCKWHISHDRILNLIFGDIQSYPSGFLTDLLQHVLCGRVNPNVEDPVD